MDPGLKIQYVVQYIADLQAGQPSTSTLWRDRACNDVRNQFHNRHQSLVKTAIQTAQPGG
eukprot:10072601-Lingulodinium_polyedra.AAC.1